MTEASAGPYGNRARLLERLDHMVEAGQVTQDEAAQLRTATTDDEFEAAIVAIRSRHAEPALRAAVEAGGMSQSDADTDLARIRSGEHPPGLRSHLGRYTRRRKG